MAAASAYRRLPGQKQKRQPELTTIVVVGFQLPHRRCCRNSYYRPATPHRRCRRVVALTDLDIIIPCVLLQVPQESKVEHSIAGLPIPSSLPPFEKSTLGAMILGALLSECKCPWCGEPIGRRVVLNGAWFCAKGRGDCERKIRAHLMDVKETRLLDKFAAEAGHIRMLAEEVRREVEHEQNTRYADPPRVLTPQEPRKRISMETLCMLAVESYGAMVKMHGAELAQASLRRYLAPSAE